MPAATVRAVPPGRLNRHGLQSSACFKALILQQTIDLIRFATQADHQHGGKVRMARVSAERAAKHVERFAFGVDRAALTMRQRDHAVHIRKRCERFRMDIATKIIGDGASGRRGAIDGR